MRNKIREIILFCLPLIAGQVGQMMFGIGDIIVAGRHSSEMVAALGVANGLFSPFFMICLGLSFAVAPLTARFIGQSKGDHNLFSSAIVASLGFCFIAHIGILIVASQIEHFHIQEVLVPEVIKYIKICTPSLYGAILFQVCKEYLQGHLKTYFSNGLIVVMNFVNIAMNIILIFGYGPIPAFGIEGAAWATLFSRTFMGVVLFIYVLKHYGLGKVKIDLIKQVWNLGFPISISVLIEVMVFATVTTLIGRMPVISSAAHNVVLNMASLTFMVPLAVSSAAGTYVGLHFGTKNYQELVDYAHGCLFISLAFMSFTASLYFLAPQFLLRIFTDDKELIAHASTLLVIVGLFQLPDGAQVTLQGILRGIGITKIPALMAFVCNWLIGLPIGYHLAFSMGLNARGLWSGLAIGLSAMALSVAFLFIRHKILIKEEFAQA
ncbi:MAG: hypothetical protein COW00_16485 [Bdellovibrio sp. CG12_big_fil_rev_8_21_14_0_65_39_13]|nr:MAG: hypothetical protein COW78_09775 [Bdellovibrio sp. CG22_combo_CG10-13_8_21_14_all_39_27]PIQ58205.1 MAG: hypothetical protein COW00_16485 [Bdellovibrio sp. CG12_big_fil_rev_8_21_14_0_65_39_13]PIR36615.1 MAG: hypothetical protein COV37_02000 [Bdellovibrio sp. CG11_big_fil_rev_8_21_14_0_20_39_38]